MNRMDESDLAQMIAQAAAEQSLRRLYWMSMRRFARLTAAVWDVS